MRVPCFIAGPYAAPTAPEIQENVRRAVHVGRIAAAFGYAPLVPHAIGYLGAHGSPYEDDHDGATRKMALACGEALAVTVAKAGGLLWIIERDDGSFSSGTRLELDAFLEAARYTFGHANGRIERRSFDRWLAFARKAHGPVVVPALPVLPDPEGEKS